MTRHCLHKRRIIKHLDLAIDGYGSDLGLDVEFSSASFCTSTLVGKISVSHSVTFWEINKIQYNIHINLKKTLQNTGYKKYIKILNIFVSKFDIICSIGCKQGSAIQINKYPFAIFGRTYTQSSLPDFFWIYKV